MSPQVEEEEQKVVVVDLELNNSNIKSRINENQNHIFNFVNAEENFNPLLMSEYNESEIDEIN